MRREKGVAVLVLVAMLLGISHSSSASDTSRKSMLSGATSSTVNPIGSSAVFPIYGDVYPKGFYYVQVNIGQPPRPYFVDPDTGSDLTWLQCDAPCRRCSKGPHPLYHPSNDLVVCKDPLCASLHSSADYKCETPEQCDYEVEYADEGSSLGVLVRDNLSLNLTNGMRVSPRLAIGCGYDQIPGRSNHPLDGVLGLGKGKTSIVSQLHSQGLVRNVVGHCLSGRGGGFLFFGDEVYDSSRVVWAPMSRDYSHYSPGFAELILGGKATGYKNLLVIFDSGSSYTYLNSQAYLALVSLLRKELNGKPLREALDDQTLPLCWKGKKPVKSIRDIKKYFKPLALSFSNGWRAKSQFEIPPESYLIVSSKGNACLGILNGTEVGLQDYNIIGDIAMQDKMVIYNNEKQAIGWVAANCDRLPTSKTDIM
ncbi:aspartic proteinase Asp1-like [Actinidia eriantha]|uniref:aspartic proteinase Asp1-like n=1 Tax=Actinidia eriantha TaxID=165200 RepID=UPI00258DC1E6|nr:aspartic proteinase Asp1-like [Actinidia eriantha]